MSCAFRDSGEDSFEARLKLNQLVASMAEGSTALRQAYELCSQRVEDAPFLVDCLKEQLTPSMPSLQRIAIIELLCRLGRLPEYKPLIADSFTELVEACNIKQSRDKEVRNAAKALKNLLRAVGGEALKDYEELRAMLNNVLGLSDAEQRAQQQRQRVMEEVERDRESHRALREASWSRPEGETTEEEFRFLLKEFHAFSSLDLRTSIQNSQAFCSANKVPFEAWNDGGDILIIHLDEAILDHRQLCHSKESSIRHAIDDFEHFVKRLAKEYFFYSDLRDYDQPHILYYEEEDDGRSLTHYNFEKDPLAKSQRRHTDHGEKDGNRRKFYTERALRYRISSERYQKLANGELRMDQRQAKECQRLCQDLDRTLGGIIADSSRTLEYLCKGATAVFIISDDHLSIILARVVALGLASCIPSDKIYSTVKFDAEWTIREIRARAGSMHSYRVIGRSGHLERATERSFHTRHQGQFVRVRHLKDVSL